MNQQAKEPEYLEFKVLRVASPTVIGECNPVLMVKPKASAFIASNATGVLRHEQDLAEVRSMAVESATAIKTAFAK